MFRPLLIAALIGAAALVANGASAQTGVLRANFIGCLTEDALDEIIGAFVREDLRHAESLIGVSCVPVGGREFSIVDRGFTTSQVRVYVGDQSILLWVPTEATR